MRLRFLLTLMVLVVAAPVPEAWASSDVRDGSAAASHRGLVVRFPGATAELVDRALAQIVRAPDRAPLILDADEPRFIDPVRQGLLAAQFLHDARMARGACATGRPGYNALIDEASDALDFLERDRAGALLAQARTALLCDTTVLSPPQLARAAFLSGALEVSCGRDGSAGFARALDIWPDFPPPASSPDNVQAAFRQAMAHRGDRPGLPVRYAPDLAGLELRIDGTPAVDKDAHLVPGEHFVQLLDPAGRVVAQEWVTLERGASTPKELPSPAIQPLSPAELLTSLEHGIARGQLSPTLRAVLTDLLEAADAPWLVMVVPAHEGSPAVALRLDRTDAVEVHRLEDPPDAQRSLRQRAGTPLVGGFAAGAVLAGGVYGYAAYRIAIADDYAPGDPEGLALARAGDAAGVASLVCLAGAGVSAAVTWWLPARAARRASRHGPAPVSLRLAAGPRNIGIQLGGRW